MVSENENILPRQYVLDTNILISDPSAPFKFEEHDVVITMTVLEELDHLKDSGSSRHAMVNKDARVAIQTLKSIIYGKSKEVLREGVPIGEGAGKLIILNDYETVERIKLQDSVPDNRILSAALHLQNEDKDKVTILVTKDVNLQIKSMFAGLNRVEDYFNDQQLDDIDYLTSGFFSTDFDWFNENEHINVKSVKGKNYYSFERDFIPDDIFKNAHLNQFFINEENDFVFRVTEINNDEIIMLHLNKSQMMNVEVYGIKPKNLMQALAVNLLMDKAIDMVQLTGPAGSGKTILALAAALEQSSAGSTKNKLFEKIIVTRNTPDMTEDIGFLPGTEEEKMTPWLAAFTDSLEVLVGCDTKGHTSDKFGQSEGLSTSIYLLQKSSNLQFKSMNFMRGRSIQNALIILDESQNLTPHQMKSLITRVGEGSKLVVLGNLGQIDAKYVTPLTSGLTHAVERMKDYDGTGVVCLPGGVRSKLSAYAEDNL